MRSLIHSVSDRWHVSARRRKMGDFLRLCQPSRFDSVLDVGVLGEERYRAANLFLKEYPHPCGLTALGIEDCGELLQKYPAVRFVKYAGREFPFEDNTFDVCHSNAVVEHVGSWDQQRLFVLEMVRVARRGFFTTPNRWFPVELHTKAPFLHYLPRAVYLKSCRVFGSEEAARSIHLLDYGQVKALVEGASPSYYEIIGNHVIGVTVTFSVYWRK
jgi:hypothetical protein